MKLDKIVLKFDGFFKESVVESNLENYRLRKLVLYYYLEDSTIMINEPKQTNSGTPQGVFLKRQAILKHDGSVYQPHDFIVGETVEIFGKSIKIVDADRYTRDFFFTSLQVEMPDAISMPVDSFELSQRPKVTKKDKVMIDFLEHSLGGGKVASWKQFLDNDRKVLKFNTVCDGEPFIVHYYLADDTLEVREVHFQNNGKDQFPMLLKRSKVPKIFKIEQPGSHDDSMVYLTDADIYPGEPIQAFSRVFHITGVDPFTQYYYKQRYGRHFDANQISEPHAPEPPKVIVPPHNGFGNEEDSLGYVYKLVPEKPKKDFFKYVDNDGKILRWTAKFNTQVPEDFDRRFIIAYYLADDTISIFEPAQKNSGIMEGKFLERNKYKNRWNSDRFITPTDIAIGGDVMINGYSFHILSCDEFTRKYLQGHYVE